MGRPCHAGFTRDRRAVLAKRAALLRCQRHECPVLPRSALQDAVSAGGPLLAVLGFLLLPLVWSVPEALVTAGAQGAVDLAAAAAPQQEFRCGWL